VTMGAGNVWQAGERIMKRIARSLKETDE